MKKRSILLSLLLLCSVSSLFAQYSSGRGTYSSTGRKYVEHTDRPSRWTLRVGVGYGMATAGQTDMNWGNPLNGSYTVLSSGEDQYNIKSGSFGAGIKGVIGVEYLLGANIGIGLNANIGLSCKKYEAADNNVNDNGVQVNVNSTVQAKLPVLLSPSIILQTGGKAINVYGRMGIVLPVKTGFDVEDQYSTLPGYGASVVDVASYKFKNSFALGYSGALGADFNIAEHLSFWVEANVIALSVVTKGQEMVDYTENGVSYISQVPSYAKTVKRSKTANTGNGEYPAYAVPFSSAGINIGLAFKL